MTATTPFDVYRAALALVGAAGNEDTDGIMATLAHVDAQDLPQFLAAMGNIATHAFAADPETTTWQQFLAQYAARIDRTEAIAQG